MGLALVDIWILSDANRLHFIKRRMLEGIEQVFVSWQDVMLLTVLFDKL